MSNKYIAKSLRRKMDENYLAQYTEEDLMALVSDITEVGTDINGVVWCDECENSSTGIFFEVYGESYYRVIGFYNKEDFDKWLSVFKFAEKLNKDRRY